MSYAGATHSAFNASVIGSRAVDIDSFFDVRRLLDSDGSIDMSAVNAIGTMSAFVQSLVVDNNEDIIVGLKVVGDLTAIRFHEAAIDECLSILMKGMEISNQRDIEEHIALEYKGSRRDLERSMNDSQAE